MFGRKTLRILASVAMAICIFAALLCLIFAMMTNWKVLIQAFSWAVLAYASYCAMKLTGYDIYEEDLRKIGWSVYILFAIFVLFLFTGLSAGVILSVAMAIRLHTQKSSIEEWTRNNTAE